MENSTHTPTAEASWPRNWLPKHWATALYRRFAMMYLGKFTSSFQNQETIDEWCSVWAEGMAGLSGEQIKAGIAYCGQKHEWPPTMAEFRACCKTGPAKVFPKLPAPRGGTDRSREVVAAINTISNGSKLIGAAYWRKVQNTPNLPQITYQFAKEALDILEPKT